MGSKPKQQTVNQTAPKSEELKALEGGFYGIANQLMGGYTRPLNGIGGTYPRFQPAAPAQPPAQPAMPAMVSGLGFNSNRDDNKRSFDRIMPMRPQQATPAATDNAAARGGKGRSSVTTTGGGIPQPYDNNTMMGQLMNDAALKQYQGNQRYNDLMSSAGFYTNKSNQALGQAGNAIDQSRTAGDKYFGMADTAYGDARNYLNEGAGYLRQAPTAGDEWYGKAKDIFGKAEGYLDEDRGYIRKADTTNKWYDDYTREMLGGAKNMLDTGDIPAPILAAMQGNIKTGLDKSMGESLNDWASRGIINSSVANRGMSDMSQAGADALQRSYLDSFNSILGGYNQSAGTAAQAGKSFTDSILDIARTGNANTQNAIGLGNSYAQTGQMRVNDLLNTAAGFGNYSSISNNNANSLMNAGSQRIADWLNIAGGYGNLSQGYLQGLGMNMKEREQLLDAPQKHWQNAFAPVLPAYQFMKDMQMDRWNADKQDTIVQQRGK